jgi:hypothetical protein
MEVTSVRKIVAAPVLLAPEPAVCKKASLSPEVQSRVSDEAAPAASNKFGIQSCNSPLVDSILAAYENAAALFIAMADWMSN